MVRQVARAPTGPFCARRQIIIHIKPSKEAVRVGANTPSRPQAYLQWRSHLPPLEDVCRV